MRLLHSALLAGLWLVFAGGAACAEPDDPASPAVDPQTPTADTFNIGWHSMNPGVSNATSACFRVSGTLGQPVPGHATGGNFVLVSGFWAGAPTARLDTIFFNGFEGCGP
jgi:hypothetical protein